MKNSTNFHLRKKASLTDSIEMLWLNAGIQKKKQDIRPVNDKNEQIIRIRQLLAAAWSEDLKD